MTAKEFMLKNNLVECWELGNMFFIYYNGNVWNRLNCSNQKPIKHSINENRNKKP